MSNAELIYAAVVVLVGLPASLKNWTATALVLCYVITQGSYYFLGINFFLLSPDSFPYLIAVLMDLTVIAVIYAKEPTCDLWPYDNFRVAMITWCWLERSFWDRLILALFLVGWVFYIFASQPWWPLYWISLAQLLAASYEALETFHTARKAKRETASDQSGLEFTSGGREWTYG